MQKYSGLNNNFNWVLTYVDLFSKFAQARPLKTKHVKNVMAAMDDIFKEVPASYRPRTIQADNGSDFKTQFEKHMKNKYNIRVIHSQAYNPSSQGAVERFNKTIKSMIYQFMTRFDSQRWIDLLPSLVANYNSTVHSSTRQRPIDIMGNMADASLVGQVYDRLKKKAEKVIENNDSGETLKWVIVLVCC
jgi:transposase InsO family protein